MKGIIQYTFLTGTALLKFQNFIKEIFTVLDESVDILEAHYLDGSPKRISDEDRGELLF